MATTTLNRSRKTDASKPLESWDWLYCDIPITLVLTNKPKRWTGSILVQPGHAWHRQPPEGCVVRGERVDVDIARCEPFGAFWRIVCEFPARAKGARDSALFEMELLADSAAYLEAHRNDRKAA